ncbi:hypothetical protein Pyn_26142 [Prunus yedoensis var. nudiflora]|uniref:Uncharacterized protein n=1 Tax=Prunus yedoensis var. nudiflora TaxID=2094558 RepID=A0A314YS76_PRUYE|nr:hypothetical protein Pyn_26142 [Prunus yedoensis var. nudiflora]
MGPSNASLRGKFPTFHLNFPHRVSYFAPISGWSAAAEEEWDWDWATRELPVSGDSLPIPVHPGCPGVPFI